MKLKSIILFLLLTKQVFGQTGIASDPFTDIDQVCSVTIPNTYYFNVNGIAFSTYVEVGGWILIVSSSLSTTETFYPVTSNLTFQSDQMLSSGVYTNGNVSSVRINATAGPNLPLDVVTSDATVLFNLQNNQILSTGIANGIWTGSVLTRMDINGCPSTVMSLNQYIYHACGNTEGLHWGPVHDTETIDYQEPKNDLNLWIKPICTPLPIELLNFSVQIIEENIIKIEWETQTEINNDYFDIEKSYDMLSWEIVDRIQSIGNSNELLKYALWDISLNTGKVYYRLKQVDIDGNYRYYKASYLDIKESKNIVFYPNPAKDKIIFNKSIEKVLLYNTNGYLISSIDNQSFIDVENLPEGLYMIKMLDNGIFKSAKFYKIK